MFPHLFGSKAGTAGEKILALDVHHAHETVVAGGYFTDNQLARDETGAFDTGFQDLNSAMYPIIIIYPNSEQDTKKPSYHTVRYDGSDAILDVAVLQTSQDGDTFNDAK